MDHDDDDGECPYCGGEGFVFECFDGCCKDCDIGCDACTHPCSECGIKVVDTSDELHQILGEALSASQQNVETKS